MAHIFGSFLSRYWRRFLGQTNFHRVRTHFSLIKELFSEASIETIALLGWANFRSDFGSLNMYPFQMAHIFCSLLNGYWRRFLGQTNFHPVPHSKNSLFTDKRAVFTTIVPGGRFNSNKKGPKQVQKSIC